MAVRLARWADELDATVAASLFALPPDERLAGALTAAEKGYWIHADMIFTELADGSFTCCGVSSDAVRQIRRQIPTAKIDLHVMVLREGNREGVGKLRPQLRNTIAELCSLGVDRWSASSEILTMIRSQLPDGTELWTEYWVERDGRPYDAPASGVLAMLIQPGTQQHPHKEAIEMLSELTLQAPVGIDGGVTPRVAAHACSVGVEYMVIGRALFCSDEDD